MSDAAVAGPATRPDHALDRAWVTLLDRLAEESTVDPGVSALVDQALPIVEDVDGAALAQHDKFVLGGDGHPGQSPSLRSS